MFDSGKDPDGPWWSLIVCSRDRELIRRLFTEAMDEPDTLEAHMERHDAD